MNEIIMIPVAALMHHPENPRKNLGDLTELTESIRKNGIMQNLTVVKAPEGETGYMVVIGNRRMEAAKEAGLTVLPCVISDMDHKTQISTMLEENMQRQDLTVYEQAQGFQMMMDLGYTQKEISEKTGFSETTINRRLKMAEMDQQLLKKACEELETERQITLYDFERLSQVKSIKQRNDLLKIIGELEFNWNLKKALNVQHANEIWKEVHKQLHDANVGELNHDERYSGKYELHYNWQVDLSKMDPGKKFIPIEKKKLQSGEEQLFFYREDTILNFYTKSKRQPDQKAPVKSAEEQAREKEIAEAWKQITEDEQAARQLRAEFVKGLTVTTKNALWMFQWLMFAAVLMSIQYVNAREDLMKLIGVPENVAWDDRVQKSIDGVLNLKPQEYPTVIMLFFEASSKDSFRYGSFKSKKPVYMPNKVLNAAYEWLAASGYQMSDTEKALQDGSHPAYGEKKEAEE